MAWLDWIRENWVVIYIGGAVIVGGLAVLAVFVAIWWYAASKYALGGLVLGWLPGAIAAPVAGTVFGFGWPLLAAGLILLFIFGDDIIQMIDRGNSYR